LKQQQRSRRVDRSRLPCPFVKRELDDIFDAA
jgi:hypothetical protein